MLRRALQHFKTGKTCSHDQLVVEMLFELDDDLLDMLARAFECRCLNISPGRGDSAWNVHFVTMLRKKGFAHRVKDFRPIAVIHVLYKLYSRSLLLMTEGRLGRLQAPQFAFRPHHQAHEVVFMMRSLIEKSLEWDSPLFVLDGDLRKAYDYTRHPSVVNSLAEKGVPPIVIAAWVREIRFFCFVFV